MLSKVTKPKCDPPPTIILTLNAAEFALLSHAVVREYGLGCSYPYGAKQKLAAGFSTAASKLTGKYDQMIAKVRSDAKLKGTSPGSTDVDAAFRRAGLTAPQL